MVEGGSILHADHPRKWVIFARRFTVLWNSLSLAVHKTQIVLGRCIPLFSSKGVPLHCSLIVLYDAFSLDVHKTQIVLGRCMPLFSSKGVPLHCSLIVLWNSLSLAVHQTQIVLVRCIPLFSKRRKLLESSCVISSLVSINPFLEICTPTHSRTSKKHGHR